MAKNGSDKYILFQLFIFWSCICWCVDVGVLAFGLNRASACVHMLRLSLAFDAKETGMKDLLPFTSCKSHSRFFFLAERGFCPEESQTSSLNVFFKARLGNILEFVFCFSCDSVSCTHVPTCRSVHWSSLSINIRFIPRVWPPGAGDKSGKAETELFHRPWELMWSHSDWDVSRSLPLAAFPLWPREHPVVDLRWSWQSGDWSARGRDTCRSSWSSEIDYRGRPSRRSSNSVSVLLSPGRKMSWSRISLVWGSDFRKQECLFQITVFWRSPTSRLFCLSDTRTNMNSRGDTSSGRSSAATWLMPSWHFRVFHLFYSSAPVWVVTPVESMRYNRKWLRWELNIRKS